MPSYRIAQTYTGVVAGVRFFLDAGMDVPLTGEEVEKINLDQPGTIVIAIPSADEEVDTRSVEYPPQDRMARKRATR